MNESNQTKKEEVASKLLARDIRGFDAARHTYVKYGVCSQAMHNLEEILRLRVLHHLNDSPVVTRLGLNGGVLTCRQSVQDFVMAYSLLGAESVSKFLASGTTGTGVGRSDTLNLELTLLVAKLNSRAYRMRLTLSMRTQGAGIKHWDFEMTHFFNAKAGNDD